MTNVSAPISAARSTFCDDLAQAVAADLTVVGRERAVLEDRVREGVGRDHRDPDAGLLERGLEPGEDLVAGRGVGAERDDVVVVERHVGRAELGRGGARTRPGRGAGGWRTPNWSRAAQPTVHRPKANLSSGVGLRVMGRLLVEMAAISCVDEHMPDPARVKPVTDPPARAARRDRAPRTPRGRPTRPGARAACGWTLGRRGPSAHAARAQPQPGPAAGARRPRAGVPRGHRDQHGPDPGDRVDAGGPAASRPGMVTELAPVATSRAGRPAVPLVAGARHDRGRRARGQRRLPRRAGARPRRARCSWSASRTATSGAATRRPSSTGSPSLAGDVIAGLSADGVRLAGAALALPGPGRPRHRPAAARAEPRAGATSTSSACSPRTRCSPGMPAAAGQRGQPRGPRGGRRAAARRPARASSTCPARSASVGRSSSTARSSPVSTGGAARSGTRCSGRPPTGRSRRAGRRWRRTRGRTRSWWPPGLDRAARRCPRCWTRADAGTR